MIDLHCHLLPGIDDGAKDLQTSLEMARIAVQDGIEVLACTPHIYPGVFDNDSGVILPGRQRLQAQLDEAGIPLQLTYGADTHLVPEMLQGLRDGRIPTLAGTRYFLLEPPHHVAPPRFKESVFNCLAAGYVPLITHPERLTWAEDHYQDFVELAEEGAWIQITAGSIIGRFGRHARYLAEQMLDQGIVHIIATDAHNLKARRPLLAEGRDAAAEWVGEVEAERMVAERPRAVLENLEPSQVMPALAQRDDPPPRPSRGFFSRFWPF